ncbi:MAG TPA: hypothetical protein PKD00_03240 [Burkholderiales bacterium]|nr:hypothetical protein [Burkholderiales bacterium]
MSERNRQSIWCNNTHLIYNFYLDRRQAIRELKDIWIEENL